MVRRVGASCSKRKLMEGFKQEGTLSNSGLSDTVLVTVWETVEKHKDKECIHQVG